MSYPPLIFQPRFDQHTINRHLQQLILPQVSMDADLSGKLSRLQERFDIFASTAPFGLWGEGLIVTEEMCRQAELYLPMEEISSLFNRFFSQVLAFSPCREASLLHTAENWLQFLNHLPPHVASPNPAKVILRLLDDPQARTAFIFATFLPNRYGGGFDRYPAQKTFIATWLAVNRPRLKNGIACLDTACGTGEGTYELAMLLREAGFSPEQSVIRGTTLEPLELFAASHAFFPHDPKRQEDFRRYLQPLAAQGVAHVEFAREDLLAATGGCYDLILCNGLLGGPFINEEEVLARVVELLAGRLAPRGVLMAADKFHGGWKKKVSPSDLQGFLRRCGLRCLVSPEGIAATKDES